MSYYRTINLAYKEKKNNVSENLLGCLLAPAA